jgi:NADH:ubiquinone oxidoreductase subunit 3 (subunit A)
MTHPLAAMLLFVAVAAGIHWFGERWGARGKEAPGKRLPYTCGEDLSSGEARLAYHRFFRLALMFVVVHVAALVIATLPRQSSMRLLAVVYVLILGLCVDILVTEGRQSDR